MHLTSTNDNNILQLIVSDSRTITTDGGILKDPENKRCPVKIDCINMDDHLSADSWRFIFRQYVLDCIVRKCSF